MVVELIAQPETKDLLEVIFLNESDNLRLICLIKIELMKNIILVNGYSDIMKSSYKNDAIKLWNNCPYSITKCTSVYSAKKAIKSFIKSSLQHSIP